MKLIVWFGFCKCILSFVSRFIYVSIERKVPDNFDGVIEFVRCSSLTPLLHNRQPHSPIN